MTRRVLPYRPGAMRAGFALAPAQWNAPMTLAMDDFPPASAHVFTYGASHSPVIFRTAVFDGCRTSSGARWPALRPATAPDLSPKTWYGMPACANADGKVVVFFHDPGKFKYRYSTLG